MSTSLCPYCSNAFRDSDDHCPTCGKKFVIFDWPEEAYSTKGMHAMLQLDSGDGLWTPHDTSFTIGRDPGVDGFQLQHPAVSRQHATVYFKDEEWHITRLGKEIWINGQDVSEGILSNNDEIQIGPFILTVKIQFVQNAVTISSQGKIMFPMTVFLLANINTVVIGSDEDNCQIGISGASERHCLIYRPRNTQEWWIVDCASRTGTRVNGKRIRNERLFEGDEINVAGVSMQFINNEIIIGKPLGNGLSLNISNAYALGKNNFQILSDVSFHVNSGEFVGILGPSGCGKSSLIQRIVGLSDFDKGTITINGQNVKTIQKAFQDSMSYIPQQIALHEDLTVSEEVDCFCKLHKPNNFKDYDSALSIIRLLGLESEKDKQVEKLSGGQKRRLAIALELLRSPELLLLDEPTSGLDPATEKSVMTYLRRISNQKRTVLCSTHIMENIGLLDKVLVLSRGYVVFYGTPNDMLRYFKIVSPLDLYNRLENGNSKEQSEFAQKTAEDFKKSPWGKLNSANVDIGVEGLALKERNSAFCEILGYLYRIFWEFISFHHSIKSWKFWTWDFWQSNVFIQLLLQPMLIAVVIKLAYAQGFCAVKEAIAGDSDDVRKLFFFCAVVVFWLGLNNSIRELVHERVPMRCLERLEHLSVWNYLIAKIIWSVDLCLMQTLLFMFFMKIHITNFKVLNHNFQNYINPLSMIVFIVLCLVCIVGGLIGLAISSMFKNENAAIGLLPIIMVPVFFFSYPIINNDNFDKYNYLLIPQIPTEENREGGAFYNEQAIYLETLNPCHTPQLLMDKLNNDAIRMAISSKEIEERGITDNKTNIVNRFDDWMRMLFILGFWGTISIVLMFIFQDKNEKEWDGR